MSLVYNELMGFSSTVNARGRSLTVKLKPMSSLYTKGMYYLLILTSMRACVCASDNRQKKFNIPTWGHSSIMPAYFGPFWIPPPSPLISKNHYLIDYPSPLSPKISFRRPPPVMR